MTLTRSRYQPIAVIDGCITCKKCGETKPEDDFYRTVKDRPQGTCKKCAIDRVGRYRMQNYASVLSMARENSKGDKAKAARLTWLNRERAARSESYVARAAVAYALRTGQIKRMPCQFCGTTLRVQAHHDDYAQPLNVMWLCQPHHAARHAYLKYGRVVPEKLATSQIALERANRAKQESK